MLSNLQSIFDATGLSLKVEPLDSCYLPDDCEEGYNIEGVYLTREKRERSNILETYEVPVWVVGYDMCTPGGHWEPDDYDYVEVSDQEVLSNAVKDVCALHIDWRLQNYYDNQYGEEFSESA